MCLALRGYRLVGLSAAAALLIGCASTPRPPAPVADLSSAHALVNQAEQSGAHTYDRGDLIAAQQEIREADDVAASKPADAARLAQKASVDARLAMARTRQAQDENSLQQVNENLRVLRSVAEEGQAPAASTPPPPPPAPATEGAQP